MILVPLVLLSRHVRREKGAIYGACTICFLKEFIIDIVVVCWLL